VSTSEPCLKPKKRGSKEDAGAPIKKFEFGVRKAQLETQEGLASVSVLGEQEASVRSHPGSKRSDQRAIGLGHLVVQQAKGKDQNRIFST